MTTVWTPCTGGRGEQLAAARLSALKDQELILCFSLDFIPGVRQIDLLILHREMGAFIAEIKAVPLRALKNVSPQYWDIEGRDGNESPLMQAYGQYSGLRDYCSAHELLLPQVIATACFPEITRHEWCAAFQKNVYAMSIAEGCLFSEDLVDEEILRRRLAAAMLKPPIGSSRRSTPIRTDFLGRFRGFLDGGKPEPTSGERERLKRIEESITKKMQQDFPVESSRTAVFSGFPGTGKTFRLMAVGFFHAFHNKRVLFACFNKTLASDLRRLVQFSERLQHTTYGIDILDVHQLARRCFETNKLPYLEDGDADAWGKMVVNELRQRGNEAVIDRFDTILVDEAQDITAWQLDLLQLHRSGEGTFCISTGEGQDLYAPAGFSEQWLTEFAAGTGVMRYNLRRNFRNTRAQYFAAQAFYEAWPSDHAQIDKVWDAIVAKKANDKRQAGFGFDRPDGEPLRVIPVPEIAGEFDEFGARQSELVSDAYRDILRRELNALRDAGGATPMGLLVLVPSAESVHATCARLALEKLCGEQTDVQYIDYTLDKHRRSSPRENEIRLCTFHSSRGLEGERVVVIGLENIPQRNESEARNLGFISLSRGIYGTALVMRTTYESAVHKLIKKILRKQEGAVAA